jgi:Protein of unknown function (DUF3309)
MSIGTILLIILILLLIGALPTWGYHSYGWSAPSVVGVVLIIVSILVLTGRL